LSFHNSTGAAERSTCVLRYIYLLNFSQKHFVLVLSGSRSLGIGSRTVLSTWKCWYFQSNIRASKHAHLQFCGTLTKIVCSSFK
jgi:hypothetical protein